MPQKARYDHIFQNFTGDMSTITIHRESEPTKNLIQNNSSENQPRIKKHDQSIKAEDLAGLSWIFLNKGDEF